MITVLVICLVCWIVWVLAANYLPAPWSKIIQVVAVAVGCIVLIRYLLLLAGVHIP